MTNLFALADRRLDWLATRQATIAENVANANSPGFRPRDLRAFTDALDAAQIAMARTSPAHLSMGSRGGSGDARRVAGQGWETTVSGNAVTLEQELMRAAETTRSAATATAALRAFHRMTMATVRG